MSGQTMSTDEGGAGHACFTPYSPKFVSKGSDKQTAEAEFAVNTNTRYFRQLLHDHGSKLHRVRPLLLLTPLRAHLFYPRKPISLISHSDVRYRGILAGIDPAASTIQLSNGTSSLFAPVISMPTILQSIQWEQSRGGPFFSVIFPLLSSNRHVCQAPP